MVCACVLYFSSSVCKALADNILPKYKLHPFSPLRCHFCSARNRNCHTPTPEDYISSSMTKSWSDWLIILFSFIDILIIIINVFSPPCFGQRRTRLEENIEVRGQKPHHWSTEDLAKKMIKHTGELSNIASICLKCKISLDFLGGRGRWLFLFVLRSRGCRSRIQIFSADFKFSENKTK